MTNLVLSKRLLLDATESDQVYEYKYLDDEIYSVGDTQIASQIV